MNFLWNGHRDPVNGGYFWSVGEGHPIDDRKQAYGHAFVLLAASSAKTVGHPDADRLLADVSEVIATRFWDKTSRRLGRGIQPRLAADQPLPRPELEHASLPRP